MGSVQGFDKARHDEICSRHILTRFKLSFDDFEYSKDQLLGSRCGSVGRADASDTRGLQF